jgi:predicted DsbA family dithiol-disulfide isomerase
MSGDDISRIDVISDAICPWCYIGKRHMDAALALLAEHGGPRFAVRWHAFQLNPDMPAEGVERAAYRAAKFGSVERGRELDEGVAAAGRLVGLEFRHDLMRRTPNTVDAHRVIRFAGLHDVQDAVVERLFAAYFVEGRDIGDRAVLAEEAGAAGLDAASVRAMLDSDVGREEVLAEDAGARAAGVNGVPTFAMDGHVLFSGAMPAERMEAAFQRAWHILRTRAA